MDALATENLDAVINIDENEESMKKIHLNKRKGKGRL